MRAPTAEALTLVVCVLLCDYKLDVSAHSLADIAAKMKKRASENRDATLVKRKMCSDENESCGRPWVCCDGFFCQRDSLFKEGRCVTCVEQTGPCIKDKHCCGHENWSVQCDKDRLGQVYGKCLPPRENGEKCYETRLGNRDSQCKSGYCKMNWISGICQ